MEYTRRDIGKMALATLALPRMFGANLFANTRFNGVQIGVITYSYRTLTDPNVILKTIQEEGINEIELMSNHVEAFLGAPSGRAAGAGGGGRGPGGPGPGGPGAGAPRGDGAPGAPAGAPGGPPRGGGRPGGRAPLTPEQQAAQQAAQDELRRWRSALSMDRVKGVKKQFNDAGIEVRLLCYNMPSTIADDEIEYAFTMAKALDVKAMSTTTQVSMAKRIAPFADKHKLMVGFHGHDQTDRVDEVSSPDTFAAVMAASKYHGVNLDIGHFTAANFDPVAYINENHARITNLHLKDRKKDHGANLPWGQGDTPIKPVLQLLKRTKWDIPANIEFEYPGDPVVEIPKCIEYAKEALA